MRTSRGFTIIEILITLVLLAVLTGIAIPHFKTLIERNQVVSTANDLVAALLMARSEAINQEATITVKSDAWESASWTIVDADDDIIVYREPSGNISITPHGAVAEVSYLSSGRGAGAGFTNADYFNVESGDASRKVCMSAIGRPSVIKEGDCP
jgi:type IV fimbrial biogenesis protein FimT